MWYIVAGLAQALQSLHNDQIYHGDIQPETIFVTMDGGIKLMDHSALGLKGSGYYRMMMGQEKMAALSPQLLESMNRRESVPNHSQEKSDIFALGITILCVITNFSIGAFYNFNTYKMNYDLIAKQLVEALDNGYSK